MFWEILKLFNWFNSKKTNDLWHISIENLLYIMANVVLQHNEHRCRYNDWLKHKCITYVGAIRQSWHVVFKLKQHRLIFVRNFGNFTCLCEERCRNLMFSYIVTVPLDSGDIIGIVYVWIGNSVHPDDALLAQEIANEMYNVSWLNEWSSLDNFIYTIRIRIQFKWSTREMNQKTSSGLA